MTEIKVFVDEKSSLVYYHDIESLMHELKPNCYKNEEWKLFIDLSTRSLKALLLHNSNVYASAPVGHPVTMNKEHDNIRIFLEKIKYADHQ